MSEAKRLLLGLFRSRSTSNASPRPNERERESRKDAERDKERRYRREQNSSHSVPRRRHDAEERLEGGRYDEEERRREGERKAGGPREGLRRTSAPNTYPDERATRTTTVRANSSHGMRKGSAPNAAYPEARRTPAPIGSSHGPKRSPTSRISSAPAVSTPRFSPKPSTQALTEWPPLGFAKEDSLSQGKAMQLIAAGAPVFKGYRYAIPHASEEYYHLYAACEGNGNSGTDRGAMHLEAFAACSLRLQDPSPAEHPWETLEQPSMSFCYGTRPGTVTLNHWISLSGKVNPTIELRDPDVKPRDVDFSTILERLVYLETSFEEDNEDLLYRNLYKNLLRDPDKYINPHKAMERQIADLITVLSRHEWIDFSVPHNQVVAKFFANATYTDHGNYKRFFHQLLLSMELDYRIHSKQHAEWAKEKLLSQLPPCIAWDLALARKWRECMTIEKYRAGGGSEQIRFHLKAKKAQVRALRKFARAMKWPNLGAVDSVLSEQSHSSDDIPLENRSSDCMSFFTGMILPGPTLPWLTMNSLIDCDVNAGTNELAQLSHIYPNTGFQYRSTTYWSALSIVGKVLAPTCRSIAGWVGPCRPAPDLERIQIARIRQRKPKQVLAVTDVQSLTERSDPLGPPSGRYPVSEYTLPLPDLDPYNMIDTIRIEKLALKPVSSVSVPSNALPKNAREGMPVTFDAAVQFAVLGQSWPLRLSYDVNFISAVPCARGPHPLFFDYTYESVRVDEILAIRDWGHAKKTTPSNSNAGTANSGDSKGNETRNEKNGGEEEDEDESEKVLLISAFGVSDNEVLARAWCSHWGLSAILADVEKSCISCAVREAYAACVNVVILVQGTNYGEES